MWLRIRKETHTHKYNLDKRKQIIEKKTKPKSEEIFCLSLPFAYGGLSRSLSTSGLIPWYKWCHGRKCLMIVWRQKEKEKPDLFPPECKAAKLDTAEIKLANWKNVLKDRNWSFSTNTSHNSHLTWNYSSTQFPAQVVMSNVTTTCNVQYPVSNYYSKCKGHFCCNLPFSWPTNEVDEGWHYLTCDELRELHSGQPSKHIPDNSKKQNNTKTNLPHNL